jgi:hypothetical protein
MQTHCGRRGDYTNSTCRFKSAACLYPVPPPPLQHSPNDAGWLRHLSTFPARGPKDGWLWLFMPRRPTNSCRPYSFHKGYVQGSGHGTLPSFAGSGARYLHTHCLFPAQAVELDPDNPACQIGKGNVLLEIKQYSAAVLAFREAYARRKSYAVYRGIYFTRPYPSNLIMAMSCSSLHGQCLQSLIGF